MNTTVRTPRRETGILDALCQQSKLSTLNLVASAHRQESSLLISSSPLNPPCMCRLKRVKILEGKKKEKRSWQGNPVSPQPVLLLLSQLHVPLDHFQDVLRLVIRQARQVQLPAHLSWPQRDELQLRRERTRRGTGTGAPGAEAGITLGEHREGWTS